MHCGTSKTLLCGGRSKQHSDASRCSGPSSNNPVLDELCCPCSYKRLPKDVQPGSQILCADGSIVLEVVECYPDKDLVKCKCLNNASLG